MTMSSPMIFRHAILVALAAGCLAAASPAHAADAPYEKQLVRLAEVLGSIHYLRNLCGEKSDVWRLKMETLLTTENPSPERRKALIANFNHGYRTFHDSYAKCTSSALEAIRRYMKEGETLSDTIASRYGN